MHVLSVPESENVHQTSHTACVSWSCAVETGEPSGTHLGGNEYRRRFSTCNQADVSCSAGTYNSTENIYSSEANSCSYSYEIDGILWKPNIHQRLHKNGHWIMLKTSLNLLNTAKWRNIGSGSVAPGATALAESMGHIVFWETNISLATEEIPCMFWNPHFHHHFHKDPFGNKLEFYRNLQNGEKPDVS